jgi:hypothetical protein
MKEVPMFLIRFAAIAIASSFAAAGWAESNTMTGRPGFFKPTPDGKSSISETLPETLPEAVRKALPEVAVATVSVEEPPEVVRPRRPSNAEERQLDRAEVEHERMKERSAQNASSVQGAFNGATNERDR